MRFPEGVTVLSVPEGCGPAPITLGAISAGGIGAGDEPGPPAWVVAAGAAALAGVIGGVLALVRRRAR
ncbi:hypothetical protein ACH4YN_05635 [Streptomyces griseofuscus]|uniref:hypothetical protein n=1 Tax=Streptomyces griseofuscus TaxID=146922 RepID=UPI0037A8DFCC